MEGGYVNICCSEEVKDKLQLHLLIVKKRSITQKEFVDKAILDAIRVEELEVMKNDKNR